MFVIVSYNFANITITLTRQTFLSPNKQHIQFIVTTTSFISDNNIMDITYRYRNINSNEATYYILYVNNELYNALLYI